MSDYILGDDIKKLFKKIGKNASYNMVLRFEKGRLTAELTERNYGGGSETRHVLECKQAIDQAGCWVSISEAPNSHLSYIVKSLKSNDEIKFHVIKNNSSNAYEVLGRWLELRMRITRRNKSGSLASCYDVVLDSQHYAEGGDGGFRKV